MGIDEVLYRWTDPTIRQVHCNKGVEKCPSLPHLVTLSLMGADTASCYTEILFHLTYLVLLLLTSRRGKHLMLTIDRIRIILLVYLCFVDMFDALQ